MERRARIRGVGVVSAYGVGLQSMVAGLKEGQSAITPLTLFPFPFADKIKVSQIDRAPFPDGEAGAEAMILKAVEEALADAGIAPEGLDDCALVIGASGFLFAAEAQHRKYVANDQEMQPVLRPPGFIAQRLSERLRTRGPAYTVSTACSSSANALLIARDLIARGQVRRALVIGVEGLSGVSLGGFFSLMLLDPNGCRPFAADRRGLQLGEAAAALLLEADDAPASDSTTICGGANLCDIHHVTSASPDGSAMRVVMEHALADAGVKPRDIVAIKAHGTGSEDSDQAECAAMRALFGSTLPPFTGLKRYFGHTLSACGAMEAVALIGCLRAGFLPPTVGFDAPDTALGVVPLTHHMPAGKGHYLLNYFGFGGNYASLVIRHG